MADVQATSTTTVRRRTTSRKPKRNQLPIGFILLLVMIGFGIYLNTVSSNLALFFITGCCFGFILQKSRFCFTASMRDPYLTGSTSLSRAVLVAFAVTTIAFTAIKYGAAVKGEPIPGEGSVTPISFATIAGAFIFGIGMVIAGGCASGTLMRVGEGFGMQMLSLFFFVIGSLWGAHDYGWWDKHFIGKGIKVFLPDLFGWMGAVTIQLVFIAILYILATKYEEKRIGQ